MTIVFDPAADNWSYVLAQQFLEAALSCGAECGRVFVAPGTVVEGMPLECDCQLAAVVVPQLRPAARIGGQVASVPIRSAKIRLQLDLCVPVGSQTEVLTPEQLSAQADLNQTRLNKITAGLRAARGNGLLGLGYCAKVTPDGWTEVTTTGGMARWQTTWVYDEG